MCSGDLRADGAATSVASSPLHFRMDASLDATISAADKRGPAPESQAGGLNLGQLFASRYRIERQLGVGGMGAVYRVQDVELNVPVALKIIRADILSDPATGRDFEERFKQELLLARQITHPNVLRIHDLGQSGGIKYITMPLIEGADLHALLASGPMPFDRVVSLGRQIAAGMAAAHEAGIAHRDLKPQNILVDAAGRAYISDFGLAKSYQASTVGLTRPGDFFGTPRYIAPEIVERRPPDHRSDLYALGLIFYEMASGTLPFVGESTIELLMQRLRTVPKIFNSPARRFPSFSRIVMRCLERDPANRYEHAHQIVADIDAHRSPPRVRSQVSIHLPLPTRRGWLFAGVAAAVIAGLLTVPPVRQFVFRWSTPTAGIPSAAEQKFIAVLPFRVNASRQGLEHIGGGVAEALSAKLFGLGTVIVAASSATDRVDPNHPLSRIARELGSNVLVTGTVQGDAERISIVINVEEPLVERRVWTKQFAGAPTDLLTLQDQIFAGLVEALEVRRPPRRRPTYHDRQTASKPTIST